jgi:AcrR family transcriptional regulator
MPARRTPQSPTATRTGTRSNGATKNGNGATKTNGKRAKRNLDDSTPSKVIDAAIACILEEGFYRASSNEIARRAEVTWGVIQYHFGTREALLLAVLERAANELQRDLAATQLTGATLAERIDQLADFVWGYYARPEFLASLQVMLNLSHDPTTEQQTRAAMDDNQIHVSEQLPRLLREVLGDTVPADHPDATRLSTFIFGALRGMAIDQGHLALLPNTNSNPEQNANQRRQLVASLAAYVEAQADGGKRKKR